MSIQQLRAHFTVFTIIKFNFFNVFVKHFGVIEAISEYLEYTASLYAYWIIILESICQRQQQILLWKIQSPDRLQKSPIDRLYPIIFFEFFLRKLLLIASSCLLYDSNITLNLNVFTYVIYITPVLICKIRIFYYIFCLKVIHSQLEDIANDLKDLHYETNNHSFDDSSAYIYVARRLRVIRQNFQTVCKMIQLLNNIFGWSQVAAVLFCFYSQFSDWNFIYIHYGELTTLHLISNFIVSGSHNFIYSITSQ